MYETVEEIFEASTAKSDELFYKIQRLTAKTNKNKRWSLPFRAISVEREAPSGSVSVTKSLAAKIGTAGVLIRTQLITPYDSTDILVPTEIKSFRDPLSYVSIGRKYKDGSPFGNYLLEVTPPSVNGHLNVGELVDAKTYLTHKKTLLPKEKLETDKDRLLDFVNQRLVANLVLIENVLDGEVNLADALASADYRMP